MTAPDAPKPGPPERVRNYMGADYVLASAYDKLAEELRTMRERAVELESRLVSMTVAADYQKARYLKLAKHVTGRIGTPKDWACRHCRPYSESLIEGFVCVWHEASCALAALPPEAEKEKA